MRRTARRCTRCGSVGTVWRCFRWEHVPPGVMVKKNWTRCYVCGAHWPTWWRRLNPERSRPRARAELRDLVRHAFEEGCRVEFYGSADPVREPEKCKLLHDLDSILAKHRLWNLTDG